MSSLNPMRRPEIKVGRGYVKNLMLKRQMMDMEPYNSHVARDKLSPEKIMPRRNSTMQITDDV